MRVDPSLRVRRRPPTGPRGSRYEGLTNDQLLEHWLSYEAADRLRPKTRQSYASFVKDALAWAREDGEEIHVSKWTPELVEAYADEVEANYCAAYKPVGGLTRSVLVSCQVKVWPRGITPQDAQAFCASCEVPGLADPPALGGVGAVLQVAQPQPRRPEQLRQGDRRGGARRSARPWGP